MGAGGAPGAGLWEGGDAAFLAVRWPWAWGQRVLVHIEDGFDAVAGGELGPGGEHTGRLGLRTRSVAGGGAGRQVRTRERARGTAAACGLGRGVEGRQSLGRAGAVLGALRG